MVYAIKLQENVNVKHHMRVRTVVVRIVWEKWTPYTLYSVYTEYRVSHLKV